MQMQISQAELTRLGHHVEECWRAARADHQTRMARFRRYYRRFRNLVDSNSAKDSDRTNFEVPLLQWHVFSKWADLMNSWLGPGADVAAEPTAPYDQKIVARIGRMMKWRVFTYMRMVTPAAIATFRAVIFGRTHVYMPWEQEVDRQGRIHYDGPRYIPLWPDDFIVPAEDVEDLHGFSWVIHKERLTPQQLLDGERAGKYAGIAADYQAIIHHSHIGDYAHAEDELSESREQAEGVTNDSVGTARTLTVLHWYGRRRLPLGDGDVDDDSVEGRDLDESEILVHYCLELNRVIGVQDLDALYPKAQKKRPFGEIALNREGSYWTMGYGQLLEMMGNELTINHQLFTDAGEMGVNPVVFASPMAGLDTKTLRMEPGTVIFTEHPDKVRELRISGDLQYCLAKENSILAIAERVTGQSEQSLGRSSDRPNAPRTASGQVLMAEFGNLRGSLDNMFFKQDLEAHLRHLWTLEQQFAPEGLFFRVTEEDLPGTEVRNGFGQMQPDDYAHEFDFTLKFAPSPWAKEALAQRQLQLYQIDLANPLIIQNPRALWTITNKLHAALGDDNFSEIIPVPPDMGVPLDPKTEWTMILQGDLPEVNPMDNDELHLADHARRLQMAQNAPPEAVSALQAHMEQHIIQRQQKALMQQMVTSLADTLATVVPPQPEQPAQPAGKPGVAARANAIAEGVRNGTA
jgi:hypothetical protein